jgi:uracil-DNA glycosylase family 4
VSVDDERSEAIRQAAGEVSRHLAWLRDAGVREVPAPVAVAALRSASPAGPVEGRVPPAIELPPPRPASLRPPEPAAPRARPPAPTATLAETSTAPPAAAGAGEGKGTGSPELLAIREELGDCRRCKLHGGRTTLVFGVGDPHAELMFVGEGPGADEDLQGEPFVGKAGQLLTKMIEAMGYRREQVYIANVVKCRPPGNRNPEPDEIEPCEPFLKRQIEAVRPKVIVALGKFAAHTLLRSTVPITRLRGSWGEYQGVRLMPTFHPAYLLRSPQEKAKAWEDLKLVMAALGKPPPLK